METNKETLEELKQRAEDLKRKQDSKKKDDVKVGGIKEDVEGSEFI